MSPLKTWAIRIATFLSALCMLNSPSAAWDPMEMTTEFFEGPVKIESFDFSITTFSTPDGKVTFTVRNDLHVRLLENFLVPPPTFQILAPMTAVTVVSGTIPGDFLKHYKLKEYILIRDEYNRKAFGSGFDVTNPTPASSPTNAPQADGQILSKADTDSIFSLTMLGWETYAGRIGLPISWDIRTRKMDTGMVLAAHDPATDVGLSVQPLYLDASSPPDSLVIGNYYPKSYAGAFNEDTVAQLKAKAQRDLGDAYEVFVRFEEQAALDSTHCVVEFIVRKRSPR